MVTFLHRRGVPGGSDGKEPACSAEEPASIPELGRSLEQVIATHSSLLAWRIPWTEELVVHGVAKNQT